MIYPLFEALDGFSLAIAIPSGILFLLLLLLYLLASGSSIRRQAQGKPSRALLPRLLRWTLPPLWTLALMGGYVFVLGDLALGAGFSPPLPEPLNAIVGAPPTVDAQRLLGIGGFLLLLVFISNLVLWSQTRPGSGLRLWADRFRAISRKQQAFGSSHFASAQEYRRFRLPHP